MTDCPNAEMRDRLPDLLHERLDASARAEVLAHVERCADCRVELTLLREARVALTSGMRSVDVAAITRTVIARTSFPAVVSAPQPHARSTWMDWRVAASIAVLLVGGASFAIIRSRQQPTIGSNIPGVVAPTAPQQTVPPVAVTPTPQTQQVTAAPAAPAAAELSAAGGVGDLSDNDLKLLLDDLDSIDAMPLTEPEPVTVRVAPADPGSRE